MFAQNVGDTQKLLRFYHSKVLQKNPDLEKKVEKNKQVEFPGGLFYNGRLFRLQFSPLFSHEEYYGKKISANVSGFVTLKLACPGGECVPFLAFGRDARPQRDHAISRPGLYLQAGEQL